MSYISMMHIAFYTDHMDEMIDFYVNRLGAKMKCVTRYKVYADRPDRPQFQAMAKTEPEKIFNVYLEIAPGQFIELFPKMPGQLEDEREWQMRVGYSHFALLTEDIFAAKEALEQKGVLPISQPSKGPSETWQMWFQDPDGNRFEIMQYTENSVQVKGNVD